ncbi:hypothetical protein [Haloarcula sp. 1CSR25-25]|uniref:hypothetical protein n=1 Tax=Haloarcula sp. 1CSR25-25 TaxID=2862545 RepID=UPI0028940A49|nr:hypothetical protein [Haloarcula sp. 1CSR25-25]MDT3437956.1 hypothetical protein [Haloarcula sp. 1CSR25-25]
MQTTGRLNWDGFDKPAKSGRIINYVTLIQDGQEVWGENKIHDTGMFDLTQNDWAGDGEETSLKGDHEAGQEGHIASDVDWGIAQENRENNYNNGYGLPSDPAPTSPFTAGSDGSQRKTRVKLRALYILYDENGNELTGQSGYPDRPSTTSEFVVTVNNEESSTSFGDDDAQGDTDDTAGVEV